MEISLRDQVVVVTGGAARIGRAIALACARAGAGVGIVYRSSETQASYTLKELREIAPDASFQAFQADLTRGEDVARLEAEAVAHFGRIDALVNCAAIFRRTPFAVMTESDFDDHIAANLKAPYLLSKSFGDRFWAQGSGSIVNIADIYGLKPLRNYIPYCVSKAGVVMLTEALALALAPRVRVNCICPGSILVPSELQGEADDVAVLVKRVPLGRMGDADEIAATALFLLGGPMFITGAVLPVDGGQRLR